MSEDSQLTPLNAVLNDNVPQQQHNQNPSGQFAQLPNARYMDTMPVTNQMPTGVSQGLSAPEGSSRKEFFGLVKDFDYKTAVLIFILIIILCSGTFSTCLRPYVPASVGTDGKTTIIGSLIAAIIGVVIFVIIKLGGF